jgi:DNA-binding winged helix-turn-helix (wHTH) protein/Tol biopolymer transport system component
MEPTKQSVYQFGPFVLNPGERVLLHQGQRVSLTPKVFETLLALVENAGHTVSKETLLKRVWPDTVVQDDSLTFNISAVRKVLGHYEGRQEFIHTEHRVGYRFVAPVTTLTSGSTDEALPPSAHSSEHSATAGAVAATPNGREVVPPKPLSVRRWMMWAALGMGMLLVAGSAVWLAVPPPQPRTLKCEQLTADDREKRGELATDGERVYFIEQFPTGWGVAQVSAQGGEPVPIAGTTMDSSVTGISPDHRELLVVESRDVAPGTLKVVPLYGGEPRPLGNIRAYSADWSPDGTTLAYTTDGGIYLCAPDGSNARRILSMSGQLVMLHWSPDSQKLCFTRTEHSAYSLWEVRRDGKSLACLFPGLLSKLRSGFGLWTPNGKYLIAEISCGGHETPSALRLSSGPFDLYPREPTCLGFGPMGIAVATVSPDAERLFGLGVAATQPHLEEYDARSQKFKPFLAGVSADYVDFSKDGQRLAYVTGREEVVDPSSLWVSQIDGSHKLQITKPPLLVQFPRWSPDGKWITFMGKEAPGKFWRARIVSADGGPYAPVTALDNEEGSPTWSPDSSQIVFGGMVQPSIRTIGPLVIHILNLKTGQLSQVPGSEGLWTARWSPDGRYIAAMTADARTLMLFDFHTSRWVKLAGMTQILELTWSRREEAVYFNGEPTPGDRAIFRVKIPGNRLERVASLTGRSDSDWFGLTPDDSSLIIRNIRASEIYAMTVNWP